MPKNYIPRWLCLLFIVLITGCGQPDPPQNIIARVGDREISTEEFQLSYQFNPFLKAYKNSAQARRVILNTLIAEKLLAQHATQESDHLSQYYDQFKREAVIEQFWQNLIAQNSSVDEAELHALYNKTKIRKIISYYAFTNAQQANIASRLFDQGLPFPEYANQSGLTQTYFTQDTVMIGSLPEKLESAIWSLKMKQISPVINIGLRYFIVQLTDEERDAFTSENDFQNKSRELHKIILTRRKSQMINGYLKENFTTPPYDLDKKIFKNLVQKMESRLSFDHAEQLQEIPDPESLPDSLQLTPVVRFSNGDTWDIKQLLRRLKISPYPVHFNTPGAFRKSMIVATKNILDDEMLYHEGLKLGLDQSEYVQNHTAMWSDYYHYLQFLRSSGLSSEQIEDLLLELLDQVKIEIFVDNLQSVDSAAADMVAMKTHFPLRSIAPVLSPVNIFSRFQAKLNSLWPEN